VVILGHVDHGKSSVLEAIKDLKITSKESGGITQHIGAYQIEHEGKKITFIDTPGHEAFSAMRSRGTKTADIAVLVIAAEESIKPQTKEAIEHIKKSGLPFIVALNKVDKPTADPERVKRELIQKDVIVESMGGKIPSVNTSATTKKGVPELLEMILLVAEMEDLKADLSQKAQGFVIESCINSNKGPIATLIVKNGVLKQGDIVGTNSAFGKAKSLQDFQEKPIKKADPSMPVLVLGFEKAPKTGEEFKVFDNAESAKTEIENNTEIPNSEQLETKETCLNLIIKTDVLGSLEAIEDILKDLPQEKASINIIKAGVGQINDSDIKLAKASNSIIIGFRVKANPIAQSLALREKTRIFTFEVIYELSQNVKELLEKKLSPEIIKKDSGKIKILAVFKKDKKNQVVGGKVIEGEIKKGVLLDVFREEEKIGEGKILKLQKEKQEVDSVEKGKEFGLMFQGDIEIQENDILQSYTTKKQKIVL